MFNVDTIKQKLYGIVGFNQPFNPDFAIIDTNNQVSRSGYKVDDLEFVKVEYIKDTQDYKDISNANFNAMLKRMQEEAITNVCNLVFASKPAYTDRNLLYRFASNKTTPINLPDGFVGYRIHVSDEKNVAFKITRVLLEFAGNPTFKLMLFNTAKPDAPLFEKDITISNIQQEEVLNWVVNNDGTYYKGEYRLGYIIDNTITPYERKYENANILSCYTYLNIQPVKVPGHSGTTLFDLKDDEGLSEYCGVNPDITVYDDYTDLIVQNEHLFARAIYLDFGIRCLSQISSSIRSNRNERIGMEMLGRVIATVEGQSGEGLATISGLKPQLRGVIKQLRKEIEMLNEGYFGGAIQMVTQT